MLLYKEDCIKVNMVNSKDVVGENKERDAEILNLHLEALSPEEIIEVYNSKHPDTPLKVGVRRVEDIIYENASVVKIDKQKVSAQQTLRVMRQIKKLEKTGTKKDVLEWENLLHDKVDSQKIEHSGEISGRETTVINVILPEEHKSEHRLCVDEEASRSIQITD